MKRIIYLLVITTLVSCNMYDTKSENFVSVCECIENIEGNIDSLESKLRNCTECLQKKDMALIDSFYINCPIFFEHINTLSITPYLSRMDSVKETESRNIILGDFKQIYPEDIGVSYTLDSSFNTIYEDNKVVEKYKVKWKSNTNYEAMLIRTEQNDLRKVGDTFNVELIGTCHDTLIISAKRKGMTITYLSVPI